VNLKLQFLKKLLTLKDNADEWNAIKKRDYEDAPVKKATKKKATAKKKVVKKRK
jgi:hypothetical protein